MEGLYGAVFSLLLHALSNLLRSLTISNGHFLSCKSTKNIQLIIALSWCYSVVKGGEDENGAVRGGQRAEDAMEANVRHDADGLAHPRPLSVQDGFEAGVCVDEGGEGDDGVVGDGGIAEDAAGGANVGHEDADVMVCPHPLFV